MPPALHSQFRLQKQMQCKSSSTSYSDIESALSGCKRSDGCFGVEDAGCNNMGMFKLCEKQYPETSSSNSCVYLKGNQ